LLTGGLGNHHNFLVGEAQLMTDHATGGDDLIIGGSNRVVWGDRSTTIPSSETPSRWRTIPSAATTGW
jgi:hypothetical protein